MSPLYFTHIVYITPGKAEIAKQLCIIHADEIKAQFPTALEVFFFYVEPEANTENTPRAVIWAAWKDEEGLDKYHASDIYLKLFGALYLQGALAQPVGGLKLEAPFAGFERVKSVTVEV